MPQEASNFRMLGALLSNANAIVIKKSAALKGIEAALDTLKSIEFGLNRQGVCRNCGLPKKHDVDCSLRRLIKDLEFMWASLQEQPAWEELPAKRI